MDILVMPMQRLTRYSLLLKAVYKNTENEDQRAELRHMVILLTFPQYFPQFSAIVHEQKRGSARREGGAFMMSFPVDEN